MPIIAAFVINFSVATWTEPFDSAMYCVQTDHNVTMITGSSHSGCFMIWDKRVQRQPVKVSCTSLNFYKFDSCIKFTMKNILVMKFRYIYLTYFPFFYKMHHLLI